MNKKVLALMILPFLLTSCGDGGESTDQSGKSSVPGGGEVIDVPDDADEYDTWLNSFSKPGHLYFHYNRGDKGGYDNYCLWLWQHAPQDLEGALWAFSGDTKVSEKLTLKPMSTHWMTVAETGKKEGDNNTYIDKYGVIADIDLKATNLVDGKTGSSTSYEGAEELGFLLPQQNSMDGATNWVSDGGRETYIEDFGDSKNWRYADGKAMHIFTSTGALDEYTYSIGDGVPQARTNPIDEDTSGNYRSDIDAAYRYDYDGVSLTSNDFKDLGVGYQVFVASFRDSDGDGIGDIQGIIDSLDYLSDLGVEVLWLTPIQSSDSYHGYDIKDYYAVDKKFGTVEKYQELIYKAHKKGMKVLMDLVLNHTSKSNRWFINSQWGIKDEATGINWRDVYTWKYETDKIDKYINGEYKQITVKEDAESKNPSWYRDGESHYYYYGKFGSGMPEINYLSATTRKLVIDMARYWMSFGLDGFRLDAVKHIFMRDECYQKDDMVIPDVGTTKPMWDTEKGEFFTKDFDYSSNLTKNIMWWKEFANGVKAVYPNCFLVGENFDGWGTRTAPYFQALDSQFDFATYYHIASMIYKPADKGGTSAGTYVSSHPTETYDVFGSADYFPLGDTGINVRGGMRSDFIDGQFTSNHDVMRAINQVNWTNWDAKDGTTANTNITGTAEQINRAKVHAAVTLLGQGVSWIYYGDELGMSSNTNEHSKYKVGDNNIDIWYRQPFKWTNEKIRPNYKAGMFSFEYDSYNKTIKSVDEQKADNTSMYNWYKDVIAIKKQFPANAKVSYENGDSVMIVNVSSRNGGGKAIKIFINVGKSSEYTINLPGWHNIGATNGAPTTNGANIGGTPYAVTAFMQD